MENVFIVQSDEFSVLCVCASERGALKMINEHYVPVLGFSRENLLISQRNVLSDDLLQVSDMLM